MIGVRVRDPQQFHNETGVLVLRSQSRVPFNRDYALDKC